MNEPGPEEDPYGKEDPRLIALGAELKAHPASESKVDAQDSKKEDETGTKAGQVLSELIGAPLGGAIIGGVLDHFLGTSPWLLMIMLFVGFGVAMRNIYRLAQSSSGN